MAEGISLVERKFAIMMIKVGQSPPTAHLKPPKVCDEGAF